MDEPVGESSNRSLLTFLSFASTVSRSRVRAFTCRLTAIMLDRQDFDERHWWMEQHNRFQSKRSRNADYTEVIDLDRLAHLSMAVSRMFHTAPSRADTLCKKLERKFKKMLPTKRFSLRECPGIFMVVIFYDDVIQHIQTTANEGDKPPALHKIGAVVKACGVPSRRHAAKHYILQCAGFKWHRMRLESPPPPPKRKGSPRQAKSDKQSKQESPTSPASPTNE